MRNDEPGDTKKSDPSDDTASSERFSEVISAFRDIQKLIHGEEETVKLTLKEVLAAVPESFLTPEAAKAADIKVEICIEGLFFQLAKGKVTVSLSALAASLPEGLVSPKAFVETETLIRLPLASVVKAVDPVLLRERTAEKAGRIRPDGMPDPFARKTPAPAPSPAAPKERPPAPPPPAQVPVRPVAKTPAPPAPRIVPPAPPLVPPMKAPIMPPMKPPVEVIEPPVSVEMPPEEPVAPPPEEVEIEEPVAVEKPIPVPPPAPPAPQPPRRKARPALPPEYVDESSYQEIETFGAVNLNAANVEQMMTLDGMTPGIADSIVRYRKEHGSFKSIFDLQDVPRLGRKTFRKITGMPYSKARHHRSWKLAKLLEMPVSKVTHLPTMAEAIARMPGFSGCVMSDCDGMLLAQSGAGTYAQAMSAVAPKILMQAGGSMDLLNVGSIESVSISIKDRMFTLVACQKVCLTAIHAKEKLGKGQLVLIRKIAKELAWLLSHRAYVGR